VAATSLGHMPLVKPKKCRLWVGHSVSCAIVQPVIHVHWGAISGEVAQPLQWLQLPLCGLLRRAACVVCCACATCQECFSMLFSQGTNNITTWFYAVDSTN
jgi:hypothetical protein